MRRFACLLFALSVVPVNLFADQITLKNGDRITGTIVKSDGKKLTVKTDAMGEVIIDWPAVQAMSSKDQLHLTLKDGRQLEGTVTTADGNLQVETKSGPVTTPVGEIASLRNPAEQALYEKTLHPTLFQSWTAEANVGFALTAGNSETKNLAVAFKGTRKTLNDKLSLYANSVYATNDAPGAVPSTTANAVLGGFRYDRDFTARVFGFVGADFATDALQTLDLRTVLGGGLGYHAVKAEATTLDFLAGMTYTRENYATFTRNFPAAMFGNELAHKFRGNTTLTQRFSFFPDLKNTGEYRARFDVGTVTKLNTWLGWQNAFGDIYVTNPPAGKKKNDIILTTGLNVSFAH